MLRFHLCSQAALTVAAALLYCGCNYDLDSVKVPCLSDKDCQKVLDRGAGDLNLDRPGASEMGADPARSWVKTSSNSGGWQRAR